jgi:hypothetical protein
MNALHPEDRAMDDWHARLAAGEPFEQEGRLRRADGEYRRFLLRFVPLRDEGGNIVEWYATSTDIEDLKRAEEELRRRPLRDADGARPRQSRDATGQLAVGAHEVSQPIAAALTNANAARCWLGAEPPDLEEVRQALAGSSGTAGKSRDITPDRRAVRRPARKHQLDINHDARSHRSDAQRTAQKPDQAADPAGGRPTAHTGRPDSATASDAKPHPQRIRSHERIERDAARAGQN